MDTGRVSICPVCSSEFKMTNYSHKYCSRKCQRIGSKEKEKQLVKMQERRRWLDNIKMKSGCNICGYNKAPEALQFDHINPSDKEFVISQDMKVAKRRVIAEIAKCRILCANCHAIETKRQGHHKK